MAADINGMTYRNPVISGFHPDPSICRVNEDFFLVTSSFEYFPGVPLFHSKDLVHWKQIGHVLTRTSQLDLRTAGSSGGIYAPSIRYHNGLFYMTTTNVSGGGNFYVYTDNPWGDWSEPVYIDQPGIDPDIFFDDDGAVYYTTSHDAQGQGAYQSRIDIKTGERLTNVKLIWSGSGGQHPEAPHLYKIEDWYYLMMAEGGTEYGHMVTIARSKRPNGPFEECPQNPILSHRSLLTPIQATGHADLVEAADGTWWSVFLGIRPVGYPRHHHLGRETFLAPVTWTEKGWPVIGEQGTVAELMSAGALQLQAVPEASVRDDFEHKDLQPCWTFLRAPDPENWSLTAHNSALTLFGSPVTLNEAGAPAFVGRRQQHFVGRFATHLTFAAKRNGEEAGLTVFMNEKFHYEIAILYTADERKLIFRRRLGTLWKMEQEVPWPSDTVILAVRADQYKYTFEYIDNDEPVILGTGECGLLSTEVAGGFTGVFIAMYATGNGVRSVTPAHFDWFDYEIGE